MSRNAKKEASPRRHGGQGEGIRKKQPRIARRTRIGFFMCASAYGLRASLRQRGMGSRYSLSQRRPPQRAQQRRSPGTPLESLGLDMSALPGLTQRIPTPPTEGGMGHPFQD